MSTVPRPIVTTGDEEGTPLMAVDNQIATDELAFHLDSSWSKNAFLVDDMSLNPDTKEGKADIANRYWSSAEAKFTDARPGANIGINCKPQYTRYSDVRVKGRLADRNEVSLTSTNGNYGIGRYYSEAIDDPSQTIYMRFGVEQFNSLSTFLANAFDPDLTSLARTGRATGVFYNLGKAAGTLTAVVAFPAVAALVAGAKLLNWVFSRPTSKFYTVKPTMGLYWSTVEMLVNNIAVNKGILPKIFRNDDEGRRLGQPFKFDEGYLAQLAALMPDLFPPDSDGKAKGGFNIYALANRAQRIANHAFLQDYQRLDNDVSTASDWVGYLQKELSGSGSHATYISKPNGTPSLSAFLNKVVSLKYYLSDDNSPRMESDPRVVTDSKDPKAKRDPSWFESFAEYFDAEFRDGSQFAVFKVEHTGPQTDSFTNASIESSLSQKLNSVSSEARQARFAFAEGNLIGGMIGDALGGAIDAVKDTALGALDGVTMGFSNLIPGLGGSGYIDIPKHWQSSSANIARSTYKIHLGTPYGNPISQMMSIYIPLAMILAGALPRSTGKQSYTSPFLCQIFDRGRQQIKIGMIESISIQRGVSHLAFDLKGNALALEVTFTVADLSSILHMPVSTGSIFTADAGLDEDNILSDYLAVLAGQDMYSQMYAMPKAKLRLAKAAVSLQKVTSPAYWAAMVHDSATSGILQYLTLGAGHVLEGFAREAEVSAGSIQ